MTTTFPGFTRARIATSGATINVLTCGSGPPVLLLHGYPQTHVMWHEIAADLARDFTVVLTDLRGYGDSEKPPGGPNHEAYAKRAMARDQVEVMRRLGFERFAVVGHDRGGRVAHRLALDHPERVSKLAVLDIVPTRELYRTAATPFATLYYHWFFLIQPQPLPETLIGADPEFWMRSLFAREFSTTVAPEAFAEYLRCYATPEAIHASCEDYRAGATYDFALDEADRGVKKIVAPMLALWAARGEVGKWYDVLDIWRDWAGDVRGHAIDAGHFMAEENPDATYAALREFFAG